MSLRKLLALPAAALLLASVSACLGESTTETQQCVRGSIPVVTGDTVTTASGLKYINVQAGTGDSVQSNSLSVTLDFNLYLPDGTFADAGRSQTWPQSEIARSVAGFKEGLVGIRVGGVRRLIVPPSLGFGATEQGNCIPANSTLIFDIGIRAVQNPAPL